MIYQSVRFLKLLLLAIPIVAKAQIPKKGLMLYIPVDGSITDNSGNFIQLAAKGGVQFATDRYGSEQGALYFDGIDDEINSNLPGPLDSSSRTVAFWANYLPSSKTLSAVTFGGNGIGDRFNCGFNFFGTGPMIDVAESVITYSPLSSTKTNEWHHYAYVLRGSGRTSDVLLYQDGIRLSKWVANYNPNTKINTSSLNPVNIGRILWKAGKYDWYQGFIDDIAVYNRALDSLEVVQLVSGCPNLIIQEPTDVVGKVGDTAKLELAALDSTCLFQWQINQGFGFVNIYDAGPFSGTRTPSLSTILPNNNLHNSLFRCLLEWGTCRDSSSTVRLRIENNLNTSSMNSSVCEIPSVIHLGTTSFWHSWSSSCGDLSIYSLTGQLVFNGNPNLNQISLQAGTYIAQSKNKKQLIYCVME